MPEIIKAAGLDLVSDNRLSGQLLARRGFSMNSYGEEVAVFITRLEDSRTRVEIVSKKVMSTNIFAPDWSKRLFKTLDGLYSPTAALKTASMK
jgi:hypothetical protein